MSDKITSVREMVENAWKLAGADKESLPGLSLNQLLELADSNNRRQLATIDNWLLIFDECAAWFANLACLLMFTLRTSRDDGGHDSRLRKVLTSLVGNISAQLIAIRRLVLAGLDVQAKQLVRALIEQLDVALLISQDVDALRDFECTADGASANDFWHKYLSKGKVRIKAHSKLREKMGEKPYQELVEYFKQEDRVLGMAIHPSLAASQMSILPSIANIEEQRPFTLGFIGDISAFSERTLAYSVFYTIFYILDGYVPEVEQSEFIDEQEMALLTEFRDRVVEGRIAHWYMIAYAVMNRNNSQFATPLPDGFLEDEVAT